MSESQTVYEMKRAVTAIEKAEATLHHLSGVLPVFHALHPKDKDEAIAMVHEALSTIRRR